MTYFLRSLCRLTALGLVAAAGLAKAPTASAQTCAGTDPAGHAAAHGLYAEYYSGYYADDQAYFTASAAKLARVDTAANFPDSTSFGDLVGAGVTPDGTAANPDKFSARYRGSFYAPTSTTYTFYLNSDDASALWIDNQALDSPPASSTALVNDSGQHSPANVQASVYLEAGFHNLLIHYGDFMVTNSLVLSFSTSTTSKRPIPSRLLCSAVQPPINAPTALVYAPLETTVLSGTAGTSPVPTLSKISSDPGTPVYALPDAPAGVTINANNGVITAAAGTAVGIYTLNVRATTGIARVFNNVFTFNVLNAPGAACSGSDPGGGPATNGLYARYYPGYFNDDQPFFANTPVALVRVESQLNFTATDGWGNITPPAVNTSASNDPDYYSARYQGSLLVATAGAYTFALTSDDASYLWLDAPARRSTPLSAEAAIDNGESHIAKTVTATVMLAAGKHDLVVHFGEVMGNNLLVLQYSGPDTGGALVAVPSTALCSSGTGSPLPILSAQTGGRFAAQVAPNPVSAGGVMRLRVQQELASPVQLTISDLQGRVLHHQVLPAATATEMPLQVPALRTGGVYLLRLTSATGALTQKLVVQ